MTLSIFSDWDTVEVWPTFHTQILPSLVQQSALPTIYRAYELEAWSYDSYVLEASAQARSLPIEFVAMWLSLQATGQPGAFSTKGNQNVMFLDALDGGQYVLSARYGLSYYRPKQHVWTVMAWRHPCKGVWPDWGSYREKGTRYLFPA